MTSDRGTREATPDEIEDEARLKQLFDASAAELSGPMLTKLRARAREVPEHAGRAPRWVPRWAWSPLLAGLAVGVGAFGVAIGVWVRAPESLPPAASGPNTLVSQQTEPRTADPPLASSSPASEAGDPFDDDDELFLDENAELAADFDVDVDQSYLDFDPLDGPADDDLDAWWEATADMIEGGG